MSITIWAPDIYQAEAKLKIVLGADWVVIDVWARMAGIAVTDYVRVTTSQGLLGALRSSWGRGYEIVKFDGWEKQVTPYLVSTLEMIVAEYERKRFQWPPAVSTKVAERIVQSLSDLTKEL